MSLLHYKIFNDSDDSKQFGYTSGSEFAIQPFSITLNGVTESIVQSYSQPYNIPVGVNESTFLTDTVYPPNYGYAWLWNDGYKVKHIKIRHATQNNENIKPYINDSEVISFLLTGAKNADGNYIHPSLIDDPLTRVEDYKISNSTQKIGWTADSHYNLLSINQDDPITSFAVDSDNKSFLNFNFTATGDYIWYATASGRLDEPISSSAFSKSLAQGYFPVNIQDFGYQQIIRGWSHANYYVGDNLVDFTGTENDPLNQFHTGSTERDNDTNYNYNASTLPFFINAPEQSLQIVSSSFKEYTGQSRTIQIGPIYSGSSVNELYDGNSVYENAVYDGVATQGTLSYFYKEDTNEILIQDPQNIEFSPKTNNVQYDFNKNIKLVGLNTDPTGLSALSYTTPEGHTIPVGYGEELWLHRGYQQDPNTGDIDVWNYNKYLHRPYKIYMVTVTGSNQLPSYIKETYVSFSSSLASSRRDDGAYIFATTPIETIGISASITLTSSLPYPIEGYDEATYGDPFDEYDANSNPTPPVSTWETASLKLYKGDSNHLGIVIAEEFHHYIPGGFAASQGQKLTLTTDINHEDINLGSALRLAVCVHTESQSTPPNSALLVTEYSMSISASTPEVSDLVPTYLDNILLTPEDCNPIQGNAVETRPSSKLMDIDYSGDVTNPINFTQLINFTALKATVPDSYYTVKSVIDPRYKGSKTSANDVNTIEGAVNTYGKLPVIDYERAFFAYCDQVIDLYPLVNNKTLFNIKYLIDSNGNALQPNLSKFTGFDVRGTWDEGKSGRVGINQIAGSTQFDTLNGLQDIFKVAKQPIPILYSQDGASTYHPFIPIIGNPKEVSSFSADFLQYSMQLIGSANVPNNDNDKNIQNSNIVRDMYSNNNSTQLTSGSRYGEYDSSGRIYASSSIIPGNDVDPYGNNSVYGKFIPEGQYTGSILTNAFTPSGASSVTNVEVNGGSGTGAKLDVSWDSSGNITSILGTSGHPGASYEEGDEVTITPVTANEGEITLLLKGGDLAGNFPQPAPATWGEPGEIYFNKDIFAINNDGISGNELSDVYTIKFDASFFSSVPYEYRTSAGSFWDSSNHNKNDVGYLQIELEKRVPGAFGMKWVSCKIKQLRRPKIIYNFGANKTTTIDAQTVNGSQNAGVRNNGREYYIQCRAMDWHHAIQNQGKDSRTAQSAEWKIKLQSDEELVSGRRYRWNVKQYFNNENVDAMRNYWNPTTQAHVFGGGPIDIPNGPFIDVSVSNAREGDGTVDNALNAPYWVFPTDGGVNVRNEIELVDPNGNSSYDQGYIQGYIPYTASENGRFPGGIEPADSNFPNFNTPWKVEKNDEIRFENNELNTYKILQVIPPSENVTDEGARLKLILDRKVAPSIEKDFFLIRRYVEADNIVIVDELFPYGGLAIKKQTVLGTKANSFEYSGSRNLDPEDPDAEPTPGMVKDESSIPETFTTEIYSPLLKKDNTPSGILFPEFAIKEIDFATDEVIRDLRDKKLIE